MLRVGFGMGLVAIGLAGLRKQYKRRRVGSLEAEGEIQQDERIYIKPGQADYVGEHPHANDDGLNDQEDGRSEKARELLCFQRKPVIAKQRMKVRVWTMEPEMIPGV